MKTEWIIEDQSLEDDNAFRVVAQDGETVKAVASYTWSDTAEGVFTEEQARNNARLGAAAPALLEACKKALDYCLDQFAEFDMDIDKAADFDDELVLQLQDAISKAESSGK